MNESDKIAEDRAVAPSEDEKTDEQLWTEFGFDGKGGPADDAAPQEPDEDPDDGAGKDDDPDDAPKPSEDDASSQDAEPAEEDDQDALAKQNAELANQIERQNRRLSAKQREVNALRRQIEAAKSGKDSPPDADETSKSRKEQLDSVKEEFPDIAGPMAAEIEALRSEIATLRSQSSEKAKSDGEAAQKRLEDIYAAEWSTLTEKHSDGVQVIRDNAKVFRSWIGDQPKRIRDLYQANIDNIVDGEGAAVVVSEFKKALAAAGNAEGGKPDNRQTNRRQQQLAGARSPSGRRVGATASKLPDDADPAALWEEMHRDGTLK